MIKHQIHTWTTDTAGAATVGAGTTTAKAAITGELCAIDYLPDTTDTGATVTVTDENSSGLSHTLWVKATAGTSKIRVYPRDLVHKTEDGAALTGTAGGDRTEPLICGQIKVVIASGGATKTGSLVVYYEE